MSHPNAVAPDDATVPFQRIQQRFAGTIRDPAVAGPEDIPAARMAVYRELFFNNLSSLLATSFPVLRAISEDEAWDRRVRDFIRDHRSHTPLFPRIAREFLDYLEEERGERPEDPPFLRELAHYEWIEVELGLSEEEIPPAGEATDLLEQAPRLSPLHRLLGYRFPVHRIGPKFIPEAAGETPTWLVVYRDRADRVGFLEANPVTARLIQSMAERPEATGRQLLEEIAAELGHPNPQAVIEGGRAILAELRRRDILI
ncbi:HvfC family RiPP maturation protein [Endothiovibrio diazotrophicus]